MHRDGKNSAFTAIFHPIAMHSTELSHEAPHALKGRAASGVCGPSARCLNHMRKFSILNFLNRKAMSC